MASQDGCKGEWQKLQADVLKRIEAIDDATPASSCSEFAPRWWLDMSEARRLFLKQRQRENG